jgi:hydroxymethylpyrimidine/phosphomethylpyrimidine kinase
VVETTDDLRRAGEALLALGAQAVLMKGGHVGPGERVVDLLITRQGETPSRASGSTPATPTAPAAPWPAPAPRAWPRACPWTEAVARAWNYVHEAMLRAPGLGKGHGPLDHGWPMRGAGVSMSDLEARLDRSSTNVPTTMQVLRDVSATWACPTG